MKCPPRRGPRIPRSPSSACVARSSSGRTTGTVEGINGGQTPQQGVERILQVYLWRVIWHGNSVEVEAADRLGV